MEIPEIDDFHIHVRQGPLMELVVSQLKGVRLVYVMPNTKPPITLTAQALEYRSRLQKINPKVTYVMTLYLSPELTPEEIRKASAAGITGVKSYPRGVTTNSDQGIEDYRTYYPVFEAMQDCGMILNLHGEMPSKEGSDICVLNAEERFLVHLKQLHTDFPKLKIVLEHATTKAAVDMVKSLGDTVGCTITLHHLSLIVDDWAGQCFNYCKPVAKYPIDREALRQVILQGIILILKIIGHPRFFLGTDSAPHSRLAKECSNSAAGVYTGSMMVSYLATILESFGALDKLVDFACTFGRKFYGFPIDNTPSIRLLKQGTIVPSEYEYTDENNKPCTLVPFMAGKELNWSLEKY